MKGWVALALGWSFALAGLLMVTSDCICAVPPIPHPSRDLGVALGFAAATCALLASWLDRRLPFRIAAALTIAVATLSQWAAFDNVFQNETSFPWLQVVAFGVLVCVGGLLCGQRTLAGLALVAAAIAFHGAFMPARSRLPVEAFYKGYKATLYSEGESSPFWRWPGPAWRLKVVGPGGADACRELDLERIEARGSIGPLICWRAAHSEGPGFLLRHHTGGPMDFSYVFPIVPSWTRSWNLRLEVQRWPKPIASVSLPVPAMGRGEAVAQSASSGQYKLSVSHLRWSRTTTHTPQEPCLTALVSYTGFSYSGSDGGEFRISDGSGGRLTFGTPSVNGHEGGAEEEIEIYPVPNGPKSLKFDLFSEEDKAKSKLVFLFPSLPGGR